MHRNEFRQKWNEMKRSVQKKWNKLTNSDVSEIEGDYETFIDKLQERQGISKEQAEREYQQWHAEGKQSGWGHEEGRFQSEGHKPQGEKHMGENRGQGREEGGFQEERGYKSQQEKHMGENRGQGRKEGGFQEEHGYKSQKEKHNGEKGSGKEHGPKEHGKRDEKNWGNDEKKRKAG